MKKYGVTVFLVIVFMFVMSIPKSAARDFEFFVESGGKIYDVSNSLVNVMVGEVILKTDEIPGLALEQRTLVPVREMFEMEGIAANVVWNNTEKSITISKDGTSIRLVIGSYSAIVDGKEVSLDACPRLVRDINKPNAKTMIPIRFVAETLGYDVDWNAQNSLAKLTLIGNPLSKNPVSWSNNVDLGQEAQVAVTSMSLSESAGNITLLFTGSNVLSYNIMTVHNPDRLVIDIKNAITTIGYKEESVTSKIISSIRTAPYDNNSVRFVLDLKTKVEYEVQVNENLVLVTIKPQTNQTPEKPKVPVIVIDAGHGEKDPGAIAKGVREKDLNLIIVQALKKRFDARNDIIVYYTRTADTYPTLKERADLANNVNADLFLSIHNNSAWNTDISGTETLYKPGLGGSYEFALICQKHLINTLGLKNRGLVKRDNLYILNNSKVPVALVEIGFMSNAGDLSKLTDYIFMEKVANALELAINEALKK